jgi:hypothetical protein
MFKKNPVLINTWGFMLTGLFVSVTTLDVAPAKAISVTPTNDGTTLVNSLLGSGVTVNNINYTGANSAASGTFAGANGAIGIDSGVILTTGFAASAAGPNKSSGTSGPGVSTILAFDFTTNSGDLFFDYVFASEEYNEFTNSQFNDSFSFLVDGINIALIPGTTTPVTINTVNGGNPLGTNASNSAFFINNPGTFDLEYDGFTTVFTAKALGLSAGNHSFALNISDVGDSILDSAVFLKAGSFSSTSGTSGGGGDEVPEPTTIFGTILAGYGLYRRRKQNLAAARAV